MIRKFGDNFINVSRVVGIQVSEVISEDKGKCQVSIVMDGGGGIFEVFPSKEEAYKLIDGIIVSQGAEQERTFCDEGNAHEYIDGFRAGVDYVLKLERAMQEIK